jgi:transcriptional regulator of acetoin/glycerol metabolism
VATQAERTTEEDSQPGTRGDVRAEAHLFRVLDCSRPLVPSARHSLRGLEEVRLGRGEPGFTRAGDTLQVLEGDARISSEHARVRHQLGRWLLEDCGSRNGTLVNGAPARTAALRDGDVIELGRTFFLFREGVPTAPDTPLDALADPTGVPGLATLSPPLARVLGDLRALAASSVSMVIHGESGTGKELVARAVHGLSGRRGAFVAVNCGAIPASLVESELFGVRRGAYSDAKEDRPGLVRAAHEGTLFLDEIGDLDLAKQAAFLRVLQEREVVPVGQARAVPVDLRVVTASHRELAALVTAGRFREDLLARLSGFMLRLPPLRARREDLGLLIAALLGRVAPDPTRISFTPDATRRLLGHVWPQNVRELEKRLETAVVLAKDGPIQAAHLGELPRAAPAGSVASDEDARAAELRRLLAEHAGNVSAVARAVGKDRVQVRRWLRRYGIDPAGFR